MGNFVFLQNVPVCRYVLRAWKAKQKSDDLFKIFILGGTRKVLGVVLGGVVEVVGSNVARGKINQLSG